MFENVLLFVSLLFIAIPSWQYVTAIVLNALVLPQPLVELTFTIPDNGLVVTDVPLIVIELVPCPAVMLQPVPNVKLQL